MHDFSDLFDKVLYMFRTSPLSIISVEILPMMDSGIVRNMYSTLSNKSEK